MKEGKEQLSEYRQKKAQYKLTPQVVSASVCSTVEETQLGDLPHAIADLAEEIRQRRIEHDLGMHQCSWCLDEAVPVEAIGILDWIEDQLKEMLPPPNSNTANTNNVVHRVAKRKATTKSGELIN